jgi:hypothetical protein
MDILLVLGKPDPRASRCHQAGRPSPVVLESSGSESASPSNSAKLSDPAYGSLLHQELARTSHPNTINPGTDDPLEIILTQSERTFAWAP